MISLRPCTAADVVFAREHLHGPHARPLHDRLLPACVRGDRAPS